MTVPMIKSIGDVPYPIDTHSDAFSPLLTAGAALGITGEATDSAAWLQRVSTADGPTTIRSIHGRTLVWNQLCVNGDFTSDSHWGKVSTSMSVSVSDGEMTLASTGAASVGVSSDIINMVDSHKYYLSFSAKSASAVPVYASLNSASSTINLVIDGTALESSYKRLSGIATFATPSSGTNRIRIATSSATSGDSFVIKQVVLFDLTAMFGAGNEPATVAEFQALYPLPYYEYDAGSLLPVQMEGIATEDADGNPLQSRTIPAGTLRGAGSVYDELTETERTIHIAEIDMGSLTWVASQATQNAFYANVKNVMDYKYVSSVQAECVPYTYVGTTYGTSALVGRDKVCAFYYLSGQSTRELYVKDSAYSDAATFKAAMDGVMLYYEVAEPTVTTYDPPLNLTYRTEQGGTERVMVPTGELSAPPTIVTAQGYTAESLRDAALSAIAPVENGVASTNYGVGSYLVHDGQLCKVTTAIATGESISIGTNVTATTVMAEVIALIAQ